MKQTFKQDKGVAGLTILLSLIVMLFVIGLLVAIFSLMAGEMANKDIFYGRTGDVTVKLESLRPTTAGNGTAFSTLRGAQCSVKSVTNETVSGVGGIIIGAGNYTFTTDCNLKNLTTEFALNNREWGINYTYSYLTDESGAIATLNDTSQSIAGVTDWFDIFIVIGAMVVLILLTVIIITAIRSSGMVAGGEQQGANQVGTA